VFQFKLPDLGEGVHEGEILQWYVKAGDVVKEDDPLVEVETDKAAVTIPAPRSGKVVEIASAVGQTVTVGTVIVTIEEANGASSGTSKTSGPGVAPARSAAPVARAAGASSKAPQPPPAPATAPIAPKVVAPRTPPSAIASTPATRLVAATPMSGGAVAAAPATRRLARELDVDLRRVPASGPGGRVTSEDVRRFATEGGVDGETPAVRAVAAEARSNAVPPPRPAPPMEQEPEEPAVSAFGPGGSGIPFFEVEPVPDFEAFGAVEREPIRSIRRKIARKMVASMVIVPHVAHMDEADVTELDRFRQEEKARRKGKPGDGLTLLAFVVKAAAAHLRAAPNINASIDPHRQEIVYKKYYNIGFAADTPRGLIVPVIKNVDQKSLIQVSDEIVSLAARAREGTLDVNDLRGGSFTVTNVGSLGGTGVIPTINYPEAAILGMGRAIDKAVVHNGAVAIRKVLPLTIAFDHRLIDGAVAARFMTALVQSLSSPTRLLMDL
jgi:pyruvate dehydrogenase E2 component (dihydrolipoamide acetyltransferase)